MEIDAKLNEEREVYKKFLGTELGTLFHDYECALIEMWRNDMNDRISYKKLRELDNKSISTRKAFVEALMRISK